METLLRFRGRDYGAPEVAQIIELIADHPTASRRALSELLCEAWDWRQANGTLRSQVCRSFMLELHRADLITLPPVRYVTPNPLANRRKRAPVEIDQAPIECNLHDLGPITIQQVRRGPEEALVEGLIESHHYLGYVQPVGEHVKYLISAQGRPLACMTWSSAPRHLGPRDKHIGWSGEARLRNIRGVAYNSRFLILPWVRVPHLASFVLGRVTRRLSRDWEELYDHPIHFVETFVHPERFKGTCYYAANWTLLGKTTGRGKDDQTRRANRPIKDVLGIALSKRFRDLLGALS